MAAPPRRRPPLALFLALAAPIVLVVLGGACRKGTSQTVASLPIPPSDVGQNGCRGAALSFANAPVVVLSDPILGPMSQLAAAQAGELLYVTGADGGLYELDFGGGVPPTVTQLVSPAEFDAFLAGLGVPLPAALSGLALLSSTSFAVAEHSANVILHVEVAAPPAVLSLLAGFPDANTGFVDGPGPLARFGFGSATAPGVQLCPTSDGRVFVADRGNHAIRALRLDPADPTSATVSTVAGFGTPVPAGVPADGTLDRSGFDSPTGVTATCGNRLLVSELGRRAVRSIAIGSPNPIFGGFNGLCQTVAGDGLDETSDTSLATPYSPVTTADDLAYWIESSTGILRRADLATDALDCPYFPSCADAVTAGGTFAPGGSFAQVLGASGALYVLEFDGATGRLYRILP